MYDRSYKTHMWSFHKHTYMAWHSQQTLAWCSSHMAFEQQPQTYLIIRLSLGGQKAHIFLSCCVDGLSTEFETSTLKREAMDCRKPLGKFLIWTHLLSNFLTNSLCISFMYCFLFSGLDFVFTQLWTYSKYEFTSVMFTRL